MSYDERAREVRLPEADRVRARQRSATVVAELKELARIVSKAIGGSDEPLTPDAELRLIFKPNTAASNAGGIGLFSMCAGGHCIGVYDDALGVCRPCTDAEEHICQQPSPITTPHPEILPE